MTNNKYVKRSGYLNRKLSLSNIDHYHDNSIKDCGTNYVVRYTIDNEKKFKQIIGRHYYEMKPESENTTKKFYKISEDTNGELKTITEENKNDLIGKIIALRSPVTCASKCTCATCYGRNLSEVNKNVNTGLVAVNKLTEPLTQKLLSAKHLLSTKTDKVEWGENFEDAFAVNMNAVYFNDNEVTISFKKPNSDELDEEEEMYWTDKLSITFAGSKKAIEYVSPVKLFINNKLLPAEKMADDEEEITVNSKSWDEEEYVFKYQPKNNEITSSLQRILDLVESNDHLGIGDYSTFVNKFNDLLIENEMDGGIISVHAEMITAVLIRDPETNKKLDFSKDNDDYVIHRVSKSVMSGPLAVSLAFERLNDQLVDLNTYEKDEVSMMDYLFR